MKKQLSVAIASLMFAPVFVQADPTLYGKANVSYASTKSETDGQESESVEELASNASRIGVKGSEEISDGLKGIYQAEFEIYFDDGDSSGKTFKQRNIFVGIQGDFGTVIAGHFDTPLKQAQKKVDLFNDLYGDIKNSITVNDNRESNSIMYSTPDLSGFRLYADLISSEDADDSNGTSLAATYENAGFYAALAYDIDVEYEKTGEKDDEGNNITSNDTSAVRAVIQYSFGDFQLGLLGEEYENISKEKNSGILGSVKYKLGDFALKGQFGQSDIKEQDATTLSLGVDYKLSKASKLFAFYTQNSHVAEVTDAGVEIDQDDTYLGVGVEVKF